MPDPTPAEPAAAPPPASPTGTPVLPPKFTPYIFIGFLLSGAITTVAMSEPTMPHWLVIAGAVGSMAFGGALGIGAGWRK